MLENLLQTIFHVLSGSAALTVKAKIGGRREKARTVLTLGCYKWTDTRETEGGCVSVVDGVWSSEVPHVLVVCPAGVRPAIDTVPPVSLP